MLTLLYVLTQFSIRSQRGKASYPRGMFIHISFLEIKVLRAYTSVVIGFIVY